MQNERGHAHEARNIRCLLTPNVFTGQKINKDAILDRLWIEPLRAGSKVRFIGPAYI